MATPEIGELKNCLVCAFDKPWGVYTDTPGASVCIECRDKARAHSPLCQVHFEIDQSGDLALAIGNDCVACSLNERTELLAMLEPFADGTRSSTEVLHGLMKRLQEIVCSNCCPSTWQSVDPQPHVRECDQLRAALAASSEV